MKKSHAWRGLPPASVQRRHRSAPWPSRLPTERAQPVGCTRGGLCGSRMWYAVLPERAIEGACGEMRAEMGMEDWEMERREGAR